MNEFERNNDPVREWLGAYLDGELSEERQAWVEDHLATCTDCQFELDALQGLASLLHAAPEYIPQGSPEAYAARLVRRFPGQTPSRRSLVIRAGVRYLPLWLFSGWAFIQAVLWVAGGLLFGLNALPGVQERLSILGPFAPSPGQPADGLITGLLNALGAARLANVLDALIRPTALIVLDLALTGLLAVVILAWLAGIWSHSKSASITNE